MIKLFLIILITLLSSILMAQSNLDQSTIEEYLKVQKEFSQTLCTPGTEAQYSKLLKENQGDGNYIPTLLDEKIDLKTIVNIIPLLDEKIAWINAEKEKVKSVSSFKSTRNLLSEMNSLRKDLQDYKKHYYYASNDDQKKKISLEAQAKFNQLLFLLEELKKKTSFLLSFKFPINHLGLRAEYEKVKDSNDKEIRARANLIYFFRKVVQDGAYDEENNKSDMMVRAGFDTLYLSLTKNPRENGLYFLTDAERVDLHFIIRNFDNLLKQSPDHFQARLTQWGDRVKRARQFYQDLADNKKIKISSNSQLQDITSMLESRSRALYNLKEFVLNKEAKTYEFWSSKSELFQSLFTLETILYSEVGRMDENVGFFRQDVAQVVSNRIKEIKFNQLGPNDALLKFLPPSVDYKNKPWLNVLFKEGEFSFTYFYIPGNLQIYCPDMGRVGRFLRKENLKIAMGVLKNPRDDFKGIRYFSRVSMLGRISMDSIWNDYHPVPEDPGAQIFNVRQIKDHYERDNFKFMYDFTGTDNEKYRVIEIKGTSYVIKVKNPSKVYTYRNPHLFKFFSSSKIN